MCAAAPAQLGMLKPAGQTKKQSARVGANTHSFKTLDQHARGRQRGQTWRPQQATETPVHTHARSMHVVLKHWRGMHATVSAAGHGRPSRPHKHLMTHRWGRHMWPTHPLLNESQLSCVSSQSKTRAKLAWCCSSAPSHISHSRRV